ncbi:MAG: phosphatase PAP2 family protein [Verrucomicrobiae bacterium]|nr:phosphatase PAP2 family protein [Verrucomicrobiae bacterium]
MKHFFLTLPRNIIGCFRGRMIFWHLLAILLTLSLVTSGFDWFYFSATRSPVLYQWMIPSAPIGGLVPVVLPLTLIITGYVTLHFRIARIGWAIGQAELLGSLISSTYKAFTGRVHPYLHETSTVDITHDFRFGLLRGGMFWGWPSSHTTIAFALALTVYTLFPRQRWLGFMAILYALYIGLGVSMTIHWFSDFAAGAIIGSVIGVVVGRSFSPQSNANLR